MFNRFKKAAISSPHSTTRRRIRGDVRSSRPASLRIADAAIETLEERRLMSGDARAAIGIGINDGSSSFMYAAAGKLKGLGVQTVRLWYSTDFYNTSWSGVLQRAVDYKAQGFDVMLEVAPQNGYVPSGDQIKNWFNWAMSTGLKSAVDRWEIGNEPDHSEYWKGSLSQYVNNFLAPAYQALHAQGEEVVSAGPSWNPADVQTMIDAGLLNYTDYVGFHPYATGVAGVENSLAQIKAVVAGRKPLVASEWNVRGLEGDYTAWSNAISTLFPDIKNTFAINYYYAAEKSGTLAGPAGIMYSNGSANAPFYNAFATFSGGGTPAAYAPTTTTPTTAPSTGNSASAGTGTITGKVFNDTNADGAFNGSDSASGVRTVFIDANGNGQLDAGERSTQSSSDGTYTFTGLAAQNYWITRVFPAGYHLSSTSANYMTVAVNPGQTTTANIGSTNGRVYSTPTAQPVVTSPVVSPPAASYTSPVVTGLSLVDQWGTVLYGCSNLSGNVTINMSSLYTSNVALVAVANGATQSVRTTNGGLSRLDNGAPYTVFGESSNGLTTAPAVRGTWSYTATPYSGTNGSGTQGSTTWLNITFI